MHAGMIRCRKPARQAGKNPNRGIGFEIGAAIVIMATFVSELATSTPRRVASADPRGVWIATNRNRAPVSRSITNRTHQEQSTQTPSNRMSRSGASSIVRGIHRLLIRSSTHKDDTGCNLFVLCRRRLLRPNHGRWRLGVHLDVRHVREALDQPGEEPWKQAPGSQGAKARRLAGAGLSHVRK
jgi:hypothetical protein